MFNDNVYIYISVSCLGSKRFLTLKHYNNKNYEFILQCLFSFHTLHMFHICLIYLLSDDNIIKNDKKMFEKFTENKKLLINEISKNSSK